MIMIKNAVCSAISPPGEYNKVYALLFPPFTESWAESISTSGRFTCVGDRRSAEEVGMLLQQHQVERVVLTACRSTHHSGPGGTIPRVLRQYGVHEIVAMSYQVLSRCVQHFTSWFYAILFVSRNIPYAVHCGRKSVAHSAERLSRFGTDVRITDDVVPVCYQSQEWLRRDDVIKTVKMFSKVVIENDDAANEAPVGFGREHDLLQLECMVLEGGRPVIVVGEPGIGKSVLLSMLAQWWHSTGCAVANRVFQLSRDQNFTVDNMCRSIHLYFHCPDDYTGQQSIIPFLRANRHLLIIDSLESMTVPASTKLATQYVALKNFIRALCGGKTALVLGSRREINFLSSYTFSFPISGLKTTAAMQLMRFATRVSRKNATNIRSMDSMDLLTKASDLMGLDLAEENVSELLQEIDARKQQTDPELQSTFATWDTDEDGIYLEEIHKFVNGHPLALAILTHNMIIFGPQLSPKRFMLGLLEGCPLITDVKAIFGSIDEDVEGLRSLNDLDKMIADIDVEMPAVFMQLICLLATFWGVIPVQSLELFQKFEIKESANASDRTTELLDMIDRVQSAELCGDILTDLKGPLNRLRTEKLNILAERELHLQVYEYMDAQGLLEKFPSMKMVIKGMREAMAPIPDDVDPAVLQLNEAMNSHEGFFLFHTVRDVMLEMPIGLDEEAQAKMRSWRSWDDLGVAMAVGSPAMEMQKTLKLARSSIIQPGLRALIASQLLCIPNSNPSSSEPRGQAGNGMEYIRTSPLLTIMLRGHPVWGQNAKLVASHRVALALLYAHRSQTWPTAFPVISTPAWQVAKVETDIEFYNLASAAALSRNLLRDKKLGFIVDEAMVNSIMKLDWHSMHQTTRGPIVQLLWESCLDEVQEMVKTLEDSHGRPQKMSWSAKMLSPVPEKDIPLEQRQTELALFGRRSATVVLAIGLLKFYNHFDDTRARRCNDVIKSTIRDIKKVSTLKHFSQ